MLLLFFFLPLGSCNGVTYYYYYYYYFYYYYYYRAIWPMPKPVSPMATAVATSKLTPSSP